MDTERAVSRILSRVEIKIRSISAFLEEWDKGAIHHGTSAAILCSTTLQKYEIPNGLTCLRLPFDDTSGGLQIREIQALCDRKRFPELGTAVSAYISDRDSEIVFSMKQAYEIAAFVEELDAGTTHLYCCCDWGQSRSAAVAAALMYAAGAKNEELEYIWCNHDPEFSENPQKAWYTPNPLVYMMLREALGCPVAGKDLYGLCEANMETAFLRINKAVCRIAERKSREGCCPEQPGDDHSEGVS